MSRGMPWAATWDATVGGMGCHVRCRGLPRRILWGTTWAATWAAMWAAMGCHVGCHVGTHMDCHGLPHAATWAATRAATRGEVGCRVGSRVGLMGSRVGTHVGVATEPPTVARGSANDTSHAGRCRGIRRSSAVSRRRPWAPIATAMGPHGRPWPPVEYHVGYCGIPRWLSWQPAAYQRSYHGLPPKNTVMYITRKPTHTEGSQTLSVGFLTRARPQM